MKTYAVSTSCGNFVIKGESEADVIHHLTNNSMDYVNHIMEVKLHQDKQAPHIDCSIKYGEPYYKHRLLAVDLETTGLSAKNDRIIEFGIAELKDKKFVPYKNWMINPGQPLSDKIVQITGITDADLADKPSFADVQSEILDTLSEVPTVIITYNNKFDKAFVLEEFIRAGAELHRLPPFICALKLFEKGKFPTKNNKLHTAIEYFELQDIVVNSHRAMDDAVAAGEVFIRTAKLNKEFMHMSVMDAVKYTR
jgi:DNA polymerase III epsilon subunit family exonuclease